MRHGPFPLCFPPAVVWRPLSVDSHFPELQKDREHCFFLVLIPTCTGWGFCCPSSPDVARHGSTLTWDSLFPRGRLDSWEKERARAEKSLLVSLLAQLVLLQDFSFFFFLTWKLGICYLYSLLPWWLGWLNISVFPDDTSGPGVSLNSILLPFSVCPGLDDT